MVPRMRFTPDFSQGALPKEATTGKLQKAVCVSYLAKCLFSCCDPSQRQVEYQLSSVSITVF